MYQVSIFDIRIIAQRFLFLKLSRDHPYAYATDVTQRDIYFYSEISHVNYIFGHKHLYPPKRMVAIHT